MNNYLKFIVKSVNISEKKGTIKVPVDSIQLSSEGVEKDAHAGDWHRQVSLLAAESINKISGTKGRIIKFGEFAENITTEGFELFNVSIGDHFVIGEVELEVTQIGKECHGKSCTIFKEVGNCVMPKEGIFCKVITSGKIKAEDVIEYKPGYFRIVIITLSDRASRGEYEDKSGPRLKTLCEEHFSSLQWKNKITNILIPDDPEMLEELLRKYISENVDFIFTTGGTGIGKRDISVDVVKKFEIREIQGIMDSIRLKYGQANINALLSRSIAGVINDTIVYTLPGSVKAVTEYMGEIFLSLEHLVYMLKGIDKHH